MNRRDDYDRAMLRAVGAQLRDKRGAITARAVAHAAGLPLGTIQALERGACRQNAAFHRASLALHTLGARAAIDYGRAHLDACEMLGIDPVTDGGDP